MEILNALLVGLPVFIILLGPLMFVHELGHFIAAKRAGVRVEEFGMGFPPRLVRLFKRGETEYTLNWLPLGAFVRMTGEEDPSDPRSFAAQPKRWRLLILASGSLMNFASGFLILVLAYLLFATAPSEVRFRVVTVSADSVAARIGLQPGDEIVSVNGVDLTQRVPAGNSALPDASALRSAVLRAAGQTLELEVLRPVADGAELQRVVLRGTMPANPDRTAPLGISIGLRVLRSERVAHTLDQAAGRAAQDVAAIFIGLVRLPFELIEQRVPLEQARPVGPIGITTIGVSLIEERDTQGLFPFVRFAGFISIVLGLTNLLPIPALDGGRILFIVIESLRGRRIDPQREQWVHAVGMAVLLALSFVVVILDISAPVTLR
ncbi:MAG: M50 family metallopeptidase [Anaerolineae bacterium]|nr:M50 family metallopeptidase [Thermoflexales bacterium]MDW8395006.1 M50 family metallopeptidase [Anaerolineae bacterium]